MQLKVCGLWFYDYFFVFTEYFASVFISVDANLVEKNRIWCNRDNWIWHNHERFTFFRQSCKNSGTWQTNATPALFFQDQIRRNESPIELFLQAIVSGFPSVFYNTSFQVGDLHVLIFRLNSGKTKKSQGSHNSNWWNHNSAVRSVCFELELVITSQLQWQKIITHPRRIQDIWAL